ncbi:aminotransferase class V-fold PLP-dependent enzyme, partial [Bacillus sp. D-CC]
KKAAVLGSGVMGSGIAAHLANIVEVEKILQQDKDITHIAVVHCETTTGIINPIVDVCKLGKQYGKVTLVDATQRYLFQYHQNYSLHQ